MKSIVIVLLLLVSCQPQHKEKVIIEKLPDIQLETKKEQLIKLSDSSGIVNANVLETIGEENVYRELDIHSNIGSMTIYRVDSNSINSNHLYIITDEKLTYSLLGDGLSDEMVQYRYNNIFTIEHDTIIDAEWSDEPQVVSRFIYNKSFFKVHNDKINKEFSLVSGIIADKEIFMLNEIDNMRIGMSKRQFFSMIFDYNASKYDFSMVDTLTNSDTMGDNMQTFIFEKDTLKKVVLSSSYDWIPFDLDELISFPAGVGKIGVINK
jgi:hypothetical protein